MRSQMPQLRASDKCDYRSHYQQHSSSSHEETSRLKYSTLTLRVAMAGPGGTDLKGRKLTANSMSVVARINYQSIPRLLLTGDIDACGS